MNFAMMEEAGEGEGSRRASFLVAVAAEEVEVVRADYQATVPGIHTPHRNYVLGEEAGDCSHKK